MGEEHVIRRIDGYGASLRRQMVSMGITQADLAEASGVSRQTLSRAMNRDEVSGRTEQLVEEALTKLGQGRDSTSGGAPAGRAGPRGTWATATDIDAWAGRKECESVLPKLIRRLVQATVPSAHASFRSGEGVRQRGWDGTVSSEQAHWLVPFGESGWELSSDARPASKANEDYAKRTADPAPIDRELGSFVFVTPRRWSGKLEWLAIKRKERRWRDLRVLDADDLEGWLEQAPVVHRWLSRQLGLAPSGAVDLESFWKDWSGATQPPVSPEFLLAGRDSAAQAMRAWIAGEERLVAIRAESRNEAAAFAGVAVLEGGEEASAFLSRCVVVEERDAMRDLIGASTRLVLLPLFSDPESQSAAARAGHRVILPLGSGDPTDERLIEIPPIQRSVAADVLRAEKTDKDREYQVAGLARRSMTAFRRSRAVSPSLLRPDWALPGNGRVALPALLAGAWNESVDGDREAVAALARCSFDEFTNRITKWTDVPDALLRRRGSAWYLASVEDAWEQLKAYLNGDDLNVLRAVAVNVLSLPDPRFDLSADERWMAGLVADRPRHSALLRQGLAQVLAVMGSRSGSGTGTQSLEEFAESVVGRVLDIANKDWKVWASLGALLPDLAEAAPDRFLAAAEGGASGDEPVLGRLLDALSSSGPFPSFPHAGLLWAVERLAWSPEHLTRSAALAARLVPLEPKDTNSGNLPSATLAAIFKSWMPQTNADLDRRLRAIDRLRQRAPSVAWQLMKSLLPTFHGTGRFTNRPRWRDWVSDEPRKITNGEVWRTHEEVLRRLLDDAGRDGTLWSELIECLGQLGQRDHDAAVGRLAELDPSGFSQFDRTVIWDAIRSLVATHRKFREADWALPEDRVRKLDDLAGRWIPDDLRERHAWLFAGRPDLPDEDATRELGYQELERRLMERRSAAVGEILRASGLQGVRDFASAVEESWDVGVALSALSESDEHERDVLENDLSGQHGKLDLFARGFVGWKCQVGGLEWVEAKLAGVAAHWPGGRQVALLSPLAPEPGVWRVVTSLGADAVKEYWATLNIYRVREEDRDQAVEALIANGEAVAAVDLVGLASRQTALNLDLATRALTAVLDQEPGRVRPSADFAHNVGELLSRLAESEVSEDILGRLEWNFLPIVDRFDRHPRALTGFLARNPDFFVEIVTLSFSGNGEEPPELDELQTLQAQNAFTLLSEWRTVPGSDQQGVIDPAKLKAWIDRARSELAERKRAEVGDTLIGEMLGRGSPEDPDGSWPATPIRDVIEALESEELERGIGTGIFNDRGVWTKDPTEGGSQERAIAEKYEGLASAVSDGWPRTAAMLRRMARGYRRDAAREDHDADIRQDLD